MDSNNGHPSLDELQRQLNNDLAQNSAATPAMTSTIISTIVVQGGPLQLVIAILKTGDLLYIKVADLLPKLTFLGVSLDEALNLQKEHEDLLRQIQNLPTPLEEFYHKVQEKIASNERPNPTLIEDMANSLNQVWMDIKKMLQERRDITIYNVSFFERLGECYGKISALEVACRDTMIPIEIESVREFLEKFKLLRTEMLSSIIATLKIGNQLLDKLKEMAEIGTLDSRPNHIKADAIKAVHQVESWLEDLSNRRNSLEVSWQSRKNQLEQCLTLAILAQELHEIEFNLNRQRDESMSSFSLGESENSAFSLLQTYSGLRPDALLLRDKSLKITKATEELVSTGCFAGDEACSKAYNVLSNCTEYLDEIEHRETLLSQSKDFFRKAENLLIKIEKIENDINSRPSSPNVISLNMKILQDVTMSINEVLQFGYSLIDEVGRTKPEVLGVKHVVEEIESKKFKFEEICARNSEQHIRVSEELNEFLERYNNLYTWLEMQKQNRIARGTDIHIMGQNTSEAKDCLLLHHQLLNDLEIKGNAINNLLTKLTPYFEFLEDDQRDDVFSKIDNLRQHWIELKNFIIERVDLLKLYIKFHQESETLSNLFSSFDIQLKTFKNDDGIQLIGSALNNIHQQFAHLKSIGQQFIENTRKVADPYLQKDRAAQCVERTLADFESRQLVISNEWDNWNIQRQIDIVLNEIMTANMETLSTTSKIEDQLYPIFTTDMDNPSDLVEFVQNKLQKVLYDIKSSENELSSRIEKIEKMETNDQETSDKIVQVKNNLNSIKTKLHTISADYSELTQVIDIFLKSIMDCRGNIKDYFSKKQPVNVDSVENIMENYEFFKQDTMSHFRNLLQQSEGIIEKIKSQEPPCAKEHDTDRVITLLENLRSYFESETESENSELKKQHSIIEFDKGLKDVFDNIQSLLDQLSSRKGDFGDNVEGARTTITTFEYFERNVELLEKRIEHFINTSKNITSQYSDTESHIENEFNKLRNKWDELLGKIQDHKSSMKSAVEYFMLIEIIETNYRNLNADLINANNKLSILNNTDLANDLINQIDSIIKEYETQQLDNLKKLSQLSTDIYGYDKTVTLSTDNMKLFQTFYKIKTDVCDKAKILSQLEAQIEEESKDTVDRQIPQQASFDVETVDELKFVQEPQQPLVIQTVEEIKYENVHEVITELEYEPPFFTEPLQDVIIQEGEKVQFQCIVNGFPDPQIEWFKDGISIQNNSDYKTTHSVEGLCTLTIDETFAADSAIFSCQASNSAGVAETTAKLSVREIQQHIVMTPPVFVKKLENGVAREGSRHQFSCQVTGNPLPTIQWYKNHDCIDNSPDYHITYVDGESVLKLEEVFLEDAAQFTVKAGNEAGIEECSAILSVEPLEPTEIPTFRTPLSNIMARVGQKIRLECEVGGIPKPEVFWTHNGKPFTSREVKFSYENDKATLVINEAFLKDAGLYTVIAKNLAGERSSSCNVVVKGRLPNETSDSEIASDMEPIKPSVQLQLKDVAVFEGKSVRLDCVIVGQPEPEVIWYHNERPVKESPDFQLLFQGDRCSLLIQETFLEDAGEYKVVAINSAGEASSKCNLSVTPLNMAEPAVRPHIDRLIPSEKAPKFERLLSDILVPEGDKIEFECCLSGDPRPTTKWFLNNKEIYENERIRCVQRDDGTVKLIIENVCPSDKGVYTVKASNPSGDAKCFSNLIVKSVNGVESQACKVELEEKTACPNFKELFADRAVNEHESTKFECIVVGRPSPRIKWYFNDVPVSGSNFLVSTSGDRQVLTIPQVSRSCAGKVSCIAENDVGRAMCVAYIKVTPDGTLPIVGESFMQEDRTGSSIVTMKKSTITSTTSHSTMGENGVSNTQFHSMSAQADHSFRKIGDQDPEISESKKFTEMQQSNNMPPSLEQQTYISITKNSADNIIATSGQISTGKPARRSVGPRFVSPLVGKIVDQGADVHLEGIVDGFPVPDVKITKNDAEIKADGDRVVVNYSLNKITIDLKNVTTKDAGRYTATASNNAGTCASTADLVVKKSIFPPVFGRRLPAQAVKAGERVIMDVEITGTPEPTVSWHKDGHPIKEAGLSSFRIQQFGNSYKLILECAQLEDAGKFMVQATNAGGEAQSIAEMAVSVAQPEAIEAVKRVVFEDMIMRQPAMQIMHEEIIPSGFSAHQESTCESSIEGSTESTVIHETRRTTEATMRMERKMSYHELPETFTQNTQTPSVPLVSASTMAESEVQNIATNTESLETDSIHTQTESVPQTENENVESVSVDKKSVIQFFEQKSESSSSIPQTPPKQIQLAEDEAESVNNAFQYFEKKVQISSEDKYTKYEDLQKNSEEVVMDEIVPEKSVLEKVNEFEKAPEEPVAQNAEVQIKKLDFLESGQEPQQIVFKQPFMPLPKHPIEFKELHNEEYQVHEEAKHEIVKEQEVAPVQVQQQKQETSQSFQDTQQHEVMTNGECKVPQYDGSNLMKTTTVHQAQDFASFQQTKHEYKPITFNPQQIPVVEPIVVPGYKPEYYQGFVSQLVSAEPQVSTMSSSKHESFYESKQESMTINQFGAPRPISPRPSAEAIGMEKMWAGPNFNQTAQAYHGQHKSETQEVVKRQSIKETKKMFEEIMKQETPTYPELRSPGLIRQLSTPKPIVIPKPATPADIGLEPGAPPEYHCAPKPERKSSQLEKIEASLFENMKEPARVPAGGVKILPFTPGHKKVSTVSSEESHKLTTTTTTTEAYKLFSETDGTGPIPTRSISNRREEGEEDEYQIQQQQQQDFKSNITVQVNSEIPVLEPLPMPFVPEPVQPSPKTVKIAPPPSPSTFTKGSYGQSDYESDVELKIKPMWCPGDAETDIKGYKSVRPVLTPTPSGRRSTVDSGPEAPPPSVFDNPPQMTGPSRPKFEPIDKIQTAPAQSQEAQKIEKPKAVAARPIYQAQHQQYMQQDQQYQHHQKEESYYRQQQNSIQSKQHPYMKTIQQQQKQQQQHQQHQHQPKPKQTVFQQTTPKTTNYYSAGNQIATETSNTMHMKETSETYNRVVNVTQTRKVINLHDQLEQLQAPTFKPQKVQPPPTPTKFTPGEFRDSDYDSEHDGKIRPLWTPNPSDSDEPQYRSVRPQLGTRSTSVPRTNERVITPMEFDTGPVLMPNKPDNYTTTLYRNQSPNKPKSTPISYIQQATGAMDNMNSAFKTKAQQFVSEIITDAQKPVKPILKKTVSNNEENRNGTNAQAYREESRVSQYGTKHVDPDTGIIYFKYDFGYEFGIIFPGEGRKIVAGSKTNYKNPRYINSRAGDIEVPVIHERTMSSPASFGDNRTKKRHSLPNEHYWSNYLQTGRLTPKFNYERPESTASSVNARSATNTPTAISQPDQPPPKAPPMFITPLKDIAVVSGSPARFECIVQSEVAPNVVWTKNGVPLDLDRKYHIEFRNGVCRLSLPRAYPDDAGQYGCTAENPLGHTMTFAELMVPTNIWGTRK